MYSHPHAFASSASPGFASAVFSARLALAPRAMPRPSPVDPSSSSVDDDPLGAFDVGELRIRKPPPAWTTAAIVSSVLAWGGLAVHNLRALPRFDGVPPVSFDRVRASAKFIPRSALFALRVGTFLFGIFFVGYHMIYEERKKHTDGMEYLSDWTILLLFATEGALGLSMYRKEREEGDLNGLANALTIAYATTWTMNLVASAGAWFSFFAYPMCATLEGVDDYPKCYLEWYRLTEHAANIVVLFLEFLCGAMPIRRRDFGWPILFMEAYVLFSWFSFWRSGKVVYDMFAFSKGLESLAWHNGAFLGTTAAFFIALRLHQRKGYRTAPGVRAAGPFIVARVDGEGAGEADPLVDRPKT